MSSEVASVSETEFRAVLGHYPSGVCVITASHHDGSLAGMAVSSFTSVSLRPPLVGFFPAKTSSTWAKIRECGRFCVNILSADQELLCRQFARPANDKFVGVDYEMSGNGPPSLTGAIAHIDCIIDNVVDAGDHDFVLGRVVDLTSNHAKQPLIVFRSTYGKFQPAPPVAA